ncbi:MAG: GNAT family N-acetyltransferase [Tumebacillaceae bacterium]
MTQHLIPEFIPEQFESERLIIRCPRPQEDAAILNAAVLSSLEELRPWMAWAHSLYNLEQQIKSLENACQAYRERTDLRMLLFSKETGELVGSSGVHRFNWEVGKFEIGYWAVTEHTGKGYITEAVGRITQFCIEDLHANRVEIKCNEKNVKSAAVAQRLGFTLEGVLRNEAREGNGELSNTMVFSKVRGVEF